MKLFNTKSKVNTKSYHPKKTRKQFQLQWYKHLEINLTKEMKDLHTEIHKASGNEIEEATHKWEDTVWLWDGGTSVLYYPKWSMGSKRLVPKLDAHTHAHTHPQAAKAIK